MATRRPQHVHNVSYGFTKTNDCSKSTLRLPEFMLKGIFMWPSDDARKQKIYYFCCMVMFIFTQWGLVNYLIANFDDYNKSLNVVSCMSTIFQSSLKMTILQYHSPSLDILLNDVSNKFWPYDILPDCTKKLKKSYHSRLAAMYLLSFSAGLFSLGTLVAPVLSNTATTKFHPFRCLYSFDVNSTPIYEILYILHSVLNVYIINFTVLGFDFLFMGIGENIISQYILLGKSIENFGNKNMTYFINKIQKLGIRFKYRGGDEDAFYLTTFINHHQLIIGNTKIMENVFNLIAALQLCSSVVAICVSGFIATRENVGTAQIATMGSYLIGHLIQLYLYCAIGNELLYESTNLTHHIFASNWYEINNVKLKRDTIFVIKNAQVPARITAFKVFTLDYSTYIKVLRLSFSFYTLLSSIVEVKNY